MYTLNTNLTIKWILEETSKVLDISLFYVYVHFSNDLKTQLPIINKTLPTENSKGLMQLTTPLGYEGVQEYKLVYGELSGNNYKVLDTVKICVKDKKIEVFPEGYINGNLSV